MDSDKYDSDVLYLHIFPRSYGKQAPNISPFAIKVETWMRLNKIEYKVIDNDPSGSPTGQIPYLYYNGTVLADSRLIIEFLMEQYKLDPTEGLTTEQQAVSRAMCQMLEEATSFTVFHFRYVQHMDLYKKLIQIAPVPAVNDKILEGLSKSVSERCKGQGIGRKTPDDIAAIGKADIKALAQYLGKKQFFFGERPTLLDCSVFGLLSQIVGVDMPFPHKEVIESQEGNNLVGFMDRMKTLAWSDWEDIVDMSTF